MHDPKALRLLYQIAKRRHYKSGYENINGKMVFIEEGQSLIGDYLRAGLSSEGEYRAAKKRLSKCNIATFKGTRDGTIATLVNNKVFDFTVSNKSKPQRINNGLTTTK